MAKKKPPQRTAGKLAIPLDLIYFLCLTFALTLKVEFPQYHLFVRHARLQFKQSAMQGFRKTELELKPAI